MNRIQRVTTALLLCGAATAMGQNLLTTNPGFESQGAGWTLWVSSASPAAQATVTYPTTGARSGTRYARVAVTQRADENWHIQFQAPANWPVTMGNTYVLRFWAKSDSGSLIHVSVQDNDYTYRTGASFTLATGEWTEYSLEHVADREGTGAIRFHVYVGEAVDVYSFDDFSVTMIPTSIHGKAPAQGQGLRVRQESGALALSLDAAVSGNWKAELVDLRGTRVSVGEGHGGAPLRLALPREGGVYFVRATTPTRAWVRKVSIP